MSKIVNYYVVFHGDKYCPPFIKGVRYMVKREMPDSYAVGKTVVFKSDINTEYFLMGILDNT